VKRALVVLAVLATSTLAVSAVAAPAANRKCIPDKQAGIQIVNNVAVIVYCGHAKANLKTGTVITRYTKGSCYKTAGNLIVAFGKFTSIAHPIALFNAFYLVTPATRDGTYRLSVLTVQHRGKQATLANNVRVVVKSKLSRGTFTGKFQNGRKFIGAFTCK
jgi:hypothetical protein